MRNLKLEQVAVFNSSRKVFILDFLNRKIIIIPVGRDGNSFRGIKNPYKVPIIQLQGGSIVCRLAENILADYLAVLDTD